jgi:hypothetical protein
MIHADVLVRSRVVDERKLVLITLGIILKALKIAAPSVKHGNLSNVVKVVRYQLRELSRIMAVILAKFVDSGDDRSGLSVTFFCYWSLSRGFAADESPSC